MYFEGNTASWKFAMTLKNSSGFKWFKVVPSEQKWFFQLQIGAEWWIMTKNQNDPLFYFFLFAIDVTQSTVKNNLKMRAWLDNFKHSSQERSVERAWAGQLRNFFNYYVSTRVRQWHDVSLINKILFQLKLTYSHHCS